MAKFNVSLTETNYSSVEIEADSVEEALSKYTDEYHASNVCWTNSEISDVSAEKASGN